jgi:hypothetical protein
LVEASRQLHEFTNNPFYSYFAGILQETSDSAVTAVVSGFQVRDKIAILEREQTIGAAPAYLKFSQLVSDLREQLTEELTKQDTQP